MWERVAKISGRFGSRKLLTYGLIATIAIFLGVLSTSKPAYAADASWNDKGIVYEDKNFFGPTVAKADEIPSISEGSTYYTYVETLSERPLKKKAHIIYFSTGQDPGSQTKASYLIYDLNGRVFSNPSAAKQITLEPNSQATKVESTCSVSGIGWIICPVSNFLASGMDWVFSVLSGFMEVQPINVTDPNNDLFTAWNVMRNIANLAFIITFLIIIYSQITSFGFSNYNVKKMLPRLIAAAILVNISYYITAVAIDISNILGYRVQDMFMTIRDGVFQIGDDWAADDLTWQNITSAILGGSAAGLSAAIGISSIIATSGGSVAGMVFLMLPVLLGLFLTTLIVLLILAARQAIIIILVIVAPLAFVANLLPNTEKWYEKWQSLFMTMLIFFPAFSLVFGASQLAGSIIIQNANSLLMVVLGMAVQVAPLVITPFLLKFSGNVLGKVAGYVNNPKKGLLDSTRNFSKEQAELHKYKNISKPVKRADVLARVARNMEYNKQQRARKTDYMKARFGAYENRRRFTDPFDQQVEVEARNVKAEAKRYEDMFDLGYEELKAGDGATLSNMRRERTMYENIKVNVGSKLGVEAMRQVQNTNISAARAAQLDIDSRVIASAKTSAQNLQVQNYANLIRDNERVRAAAGGIDVNGAQRALANAYNALSKANEEVLKNLEVVIKGSNATADQILNLTRGMGIRSSGITIDPTVDARAAALRLVFGGQDARSIAEAYRTVDFSFPEVENPEQVAMLRIVTAEAMMSGNRAPWIGGGITARLKQGLDWENANITGPNGETGVDNLIISAIKGSKISAKKLGSMGTDYLNELKRAITNNYSDLTADDIARLKTEINVALDKSNEIGRELGDSEPVIREIDNLL